MKKAPAYLFLLTGLVLSWSCGERVETIGRPFPPLIDDGVAMLRMNSLADQPLFSGEWSVPRLGYDRTFIRTLRKPGGSFVFRARQKEDYILQVRSRGWSRGAFVGIRDARFPLDKDDSEFVVGEESIEPGTNKVAFSVEDELAVSSVRVFPRRISGLVGADRAPDRGDTLFMPGSLRYYIKPLPGERLLLSMATGREGMTDVRIVIRTESREIETKSRVRSDKDFVIRPVPGEFQEIEVLPRPPRAGFVKIGKSILVQERRSGTLRRIRKAARGKSVLIILLDSARADHVGTMGYPRRTTPYIDLLARGSWVFPDTLTEAAFTLASATTLHTGLPPDFHRVLSTFTSSLGPKQTTLAELFRKKGYYTAAISANPYFGKAYNHDRGFAEFIELFEGAKQVLAGDFVKPFRGALEKGRGKPFFIYLHLREPHHDYLMPPPYLGTFQRGYLAQSDELLARTQEILGGSKRSDEDLVLLRDLYDENLLYADSVSGEILSVLKEFKLDEQTIKIITSDHGEGLGEHGMIGHNVDLQREGIQIPLIVRVPGIRPERISRPAISSDVTITLAGLFDLEFPYGRPTSGLSLFDLPSERRRLTRALNSNDGFPGFMVEQYPFRMILFFPDTRRDAELFDLRRDPGQMNPLPAEGLAADTLRFIVRAHLKSSETDPSVSGPANLREKDLENLKSLGYINQ